MSTEVKLLTLLNVSAIKRPRDLDQPGGFRSPSTSRPQSVDGAEPPAPKKKRGVVFGGEIGPSGSTYGKKGKKAVKIAVAEEENGDGEDVLVEETAEDGDAAAEAEEDGGDDDDEEANDDTFNTHFGPETPLLSRVEDAKAGSWTQHRSSIKGLGRVVEMRPGDAPAAEGTARVSPASCPTCILQANSRLSPRSRRA